MGFSIIVSILCLFILLFEDFSSLLLLELCFFLFICMFISDFRWLTLENWVKTNVLTSLEPNDAIVWRISTLLWIASSSNCFFVRFQEWYYGDDLNFNIILSFQFLFASLVFYHFLQSIFIGLSFLQLSLLVILWDEITEKYSIFLTLSFVFPTPQ